MTKLKIVHNGFHGETSATLNLRGSPGERIRLSEHQVRKLKKKACGMDDCACGESLLCACECETPWMRDAHYFITIPVGGNIKVRGNYPQRY